MEKGRWYVRIMGSGFLSFFFKKFLLLLLKIVPARAPLPPPPHALKECARRSLSHAWDI